MDIKAQVDEIRKCSKAVYLAVDESVAKDISRVLLNAADTIEALKKDTDKQELSPEDNTLFENEIQSIIDHYGNEKQYAKAIEEMTELCQLLAKSLCTEGLSNIKARMKEEIADVCVMIMQLNLICGFEFEDILKVMREKVTRTLERIEIDKENNIPKEVKDE